jgi:signal transduction histidine kinase
MMPLMDGMSLVRQIRKHPRLAQIPTILLSARSGLEDSLEGLDAGASDYLTKPFNVNDLLARCRVHIRLNRLRLQTAEYEAELIHQQARTEAKNSMLALVSHHLRTPLSSIVGAVDLMKNDATAHKDLLETISAGSDELSARIEQLLDVAKVDSERFALENQPFDLDAMISSTLTRYSPAASKKALQIFSSTPSTLLFPRLCESQLTEALHHA